MDDIYIEKVRSGDREAFRYFLKEYKDMAFSVAMSVVKDEFIAQELVQDSFVKAFNGLASFKKQSKFSTWFYRIVVNEALTRLKKLKREIVSFNADYDNEIADESVLESLKHEEQVYLINEALKKLPSNESLALRLFYLQEESIKEVCEITGWSESSTKVLLHRGRKNMFIVLSKLMRTEFNY
ncbi:sigma-70 family RNA polymerase sigma factor [Daejeonella sp.]|uniref:RNA polymerase sigma factor n=1 Tax=Daejeonella sp. TaxID=2805397 RepID=UPI0030BC69EC